MPGDPSSGDGSRGPWIGRQTWRDLLFAHWAVDPGALRPLVPEGLEVDTWGGEAWVGVIPFRIEGLRVRGFPDLPTATDFLELNVRTYVHRRGRPGVYFFSLDAASRLAVLGARRIFGLPYRHADMAQRAGADGWIRYRCRRRDGRAAFDARYRPAGDVFRAVEGTLEHFLVERYRLFVPTRPGVLRRVEVAHLPWPLRPAEARIDVNTMAAAAGVSLPDSAPLLHFADRLDVRTGPPRTA